MFMLIPSACVPDCYKLAMADAATSGSRTGLLTNICESASLLDTWEAALPRARIAAAKFGYTIDVAEADEFIKHFYQTLRHGLCVDWVLNHVCASILNYFPYSRVSEFSGTQAFLASHSEDPVFVEELAEIDRELRKMMDWVFEVYPDQYVYKRLHAISPRSPEYALYLLSYAPKLSDGSPYVIPTVTAYRVGYLVMLLEMLADSIGYAKRTVWHNCFNQIQGGSYPGVIVVGGKFEAFAYGDLNQSGPRWHRLENGIRSLGVPAVASGAFPSQTTFFRFAAGSLLVDETLAPQVSFDEGHTWYDSQTFKASFECEVEKAMRIRIRYPFKPVMSGERRNLRVTTTVGCSVKHELLLLDENNEAETQVLFRAAGAAFGVRDVQGGYPPATFVCEHIRTDSLRWLP